MHTLTTLTVAVAIALVATTPVASRQFRSGTALVLVDVVATQADGNLNRNLKRDDFLIFEDGKPQEVKQFQVVDLESIAAEAIDPPGVFSNRAEPGAVFALLLDDMNVDSKHTALMQQTARRFVDEQVRSGDYLGVMRTGVNSPLLLTTDRDLVRPMIAQTMGRRDTNDVSSLTGAAGDTLPTQTLNTSQMPDFGALGLFDQSPSARIQAEQSLVMLQRVVEYSHLSRRGARPCCCSARALPSTSRRSPPTATRVVSTPCAGCWPPPARATSRSTPLTQGGCQGRRTR